RRSVAPEIRCTGEEADQIVRPGKFPDIRRRGSPGGAWSDVARSRRVPRIAAVHLCGIHKRRCIPGKGFTTCSEPMKAARLKRLLIELRAKTLVEKPARIEPNRRD